MFAWVATACASLTATALAIWLARALQRVRQLAAENQRLGRSVDDLAAASHARSRFLAMMSHEIRTPLTGIVGFAEVLADETLSPAGRRAIDSIHRASRSLQALLGDILDFSRIDAGALPMQCVPTDLEALLNEVRDEFAPQARQRGLAFGLSVSQDARRWSETDPLRLRQIVVNLVSNAIRYTESGMVRIAASTTPEAPGTIAIQVSDTGLGIAPEDCRRIFDAFAQAAAQAADGDAVHTRENGGVGLGLAIADGLVRAMGGDLALDSTPGQGSTFTVTLPLPACPAPDLPAKPAGTAETVSPARILLVDNIEMNRELFAAMLSRAGHRVTTAEDGETALQCLGQGRFDLAIIDIQMPFMDGIELTRRIRASKDPSLARLPIVALSAAAYGEDRARAEAVGMNDYVTKPATREDVAASVARVLAPSAPSQAADPGRDAVGAMDLLDRRMFDGQRGTFGDDRTRRFLGLLAEELDRRAVAIGEARQRQARVELSQHAHAIASAAGNLGFLGLVSMCRTLERDLAAMPDGDAAAAIDALEAAIAATRRATDVLAAEIGGASPERRASG